MKGIILVGGSFNSAAERGFALKLLLTDARLRDEIAQNGARYLRQKCNETIMAGEIEDYFHHIAQKGRKYICSRG